MQLCMIVSTCFVSDPHRRWARWSLAFACVAFVDVCGLLDAGDVVFDANDLRRRREVWLKRGDRILLIEDWPELAPSGQPKRKRGKSSRTLRILQQAFAPNNQDGTFSFSWLPNVTLRIVNVSLEARRSKCAKAGMGSVILRFLRSMLGLGGRLADDCGVVKLGEPDGFLHDSLVNGTDAAIEQRLEQLLAQAVLTTGVEAEQHGDKLRFVLEDSLHGACVDDIDIYPILERKMLAVLKALTNDTSRLAWVTLHVLREGHLVGDEMVMAVEQSNVYSLRLRVFHDFGRMLGMKRESGPSDNGPTIVAAVQVAGTVEQHVFQRGGHLTESFEFQLFIHRRGLDSEGHAWEQQAPLQQSPMQGQVVPMWRGSAYIFPPRWIRTIRRPSSTGAIALELQVSLDDPACGTLPPLVRTPPSRPEPMLQKWFEGRREVLKRRVVSFLEAGNLAAPLDLNVDRRNLKHHTPRWHRQQLASYLRAVTKRAAQTTTPHPSPSRVRRRQRPDQLRSRVLARQQLGQQTAADVAGKAAGLSPGGGFRTEL